MIFFLQILDPPGPATLIYEPQRVVKAKPVNLMCVVEDFGRPPSETFRWVRGSHLIQDVTSSNWTIDPVTLETAANFTCSAYNLGGEGQSSSASIEVLGERQNRFFGYFPLKPLRGLFPFIFFDIFFFQLLPLLLNACLPTMELS